MAERIYKIKLTEYLRREVTVKARSEEEALAMVDNDWKAGNLILEPEDSDGIDLYAMDSADPSDAKFADWDSDWSK